MATLHPHLPARIPAAVQHEYNVVVGCFGLPEIMQHDFASTLTAHAKDADSVATVLWDVLADFLAGIPVDCIGISFRPQDSSDDEIKIVSCHDQKEKTPLKKQRVGPTTLALQILVGLLPLSPS